MKTIVLANNKGGCSKTTTAHSLGFGLHNAGKKVLFIDLDAQCNLCDYCGIDAEQYEKTIYNVFRGECAIKDCIVSIDNNFDLVVGDLSLSAADSEFTNTGREYILKEALEPIENEYDYCVIDTEPHLGILLTNALTAANGVVIPMTIDRFNLKGTKQLGLYIYSVKKYCNPNLETFGILLTKYDKRKIINKVLMNEIENSARFLETKVFDSKIRESVRIREAQAMQENIYSYDLQISEDYKNFTNEILREV